MPTRDVHPTALRNTSAALPWLQDSCRIPDVRISEAASGMEALQHITLDDYDLVIVDINMPVMDGLTLIKLTREEERFQAIPVIVVSNEGTDEPRDRALSLGADAHLPKPINPMELMRLSMGLLWQG